MRTSHQTASTPICTRIGWYGETDHRITLVFFCNILNLEDKIFVIILMNPHVIPLINGLCPELAFFIRIIQYRLKQSSSTFYYISFCRVITC